MLPLYELLHWLDSYAPGREVAPVPNDTSITEFRRLNVAAQQAVDRSEELFERQKQFIGNASHELQTPLAVLGGRMEYLLDCADLDEETTGEIIQMRRTLDHIVRLNKTLLLLTKIDNGQFRRAPTSISFPWSRSGRRFMTIYTESTKSVVVCICPGPSRSGWMNRFVRYWFLT